MTPAPAPPQLSPDGQWWWDEQQWIPAARAAAQAAVPVPVGAAAGAGGQRGAAVPVGGAGPAAADNAGLGGLDDLWEPGSEALPADGPDRAASASLLLALLWLCGFGSAAAVLLGHQSRAASRRRGRAPSGVATAGLVLGYAGVLGVLVTALLLAAAVG